jgi:hypothetical protein
MGLAFPYINESSSLNNHAQNVDLFQHLQIKHADEQQSNEVICPICAATINGEPNLVTTDLISHIANDHQLLQPNTPSTAGEGSNNYLRQTLATRDYDFGIGAGVRGGFRRGSLRAPTRRGGNGRGGGPVSQHFVVDTSTGLPAVGSGNDPIADLLTQLSTVRRLAAVNNNNGTNTNSSLSPSANTITLQTLTRQQYERERLRASGRSHHHHHHSQQATPSSNTVPSAENDFFDSFFSSALLIDPSPPSSNNHQTWTHILAPQQPVPEQQSQTSSTAKPPIITNTESDPSFLRRICDESSSVTQQSATNIQSSQKKIDFVQNLLLSSFDYLSNDE